MHALYHIVEKFMWYKITSLQLWHHNVWVGLHAQYIYLANNYSKLQILVCTYVHNKMCLDQLWQFIASDWKELLPWNLVSKHQYKVIDGEKFRLVCFLRVKLWASNSPIHRNVCGGRLLLANVVTTFMKMTQCGQKSVFRIWKPYAFITNMSSMSKTGNPTTCSWLPLILWNILHRII